MLIAGSTVPVKIITDISCIFEIFFSTCTSNFMSHNIEYRYKSNHMNIKTFVKIEITYVN